MVILLARKQPLHMSMLLQAALLLMQLAMLVLLVIQVLQQQLE